MNEHSLGVRGLRVGNAVKIRYSVWPNQICSVAVLLIAVGMLISIYTMPSPTRAT